MDALLGNDLSGFDLLLTASGDIAVAQTREEQILNCIKIALYTTPNWALNSLQNRPLGSRVEQLLAASVNQENRGLLEKEIIDALSFMVQDGVVMSLTAELQIVGNSQYLLDLVVDGKKIDTKTVLERA